MKKRKYISKILYTTLFITFLFFIWALSYQIHIAKQAILTEIYPCLQNSIELYVKHKAKETYYDGQYRYDPRKKKIGEYEIRTARFADTTFTYQSKIVDPATDVFRGFQTAFLETNQLYADSIQIILDSLLQEKNIYVQSIVGITASLRIKKNEWSSDTTAININYRTTFANQGSFEDINYYAYIHYSPRTIWLLMNKAPIYFLFISALIIIFTLLWWTRKQKKEIINSIVQLENGNYRIKDILFAIHKKTLTSEHKETKLPAQLYELLLMFLKAENYKVRKKDIKLQFWPTNMDPGNNMTSTINRLNKVLKDIGCTYTINTDSKNEEYYILTSNQTQIH